VDGPAHSCPLPWDATTKIERKSHQPTMTASTNRRTMILRQYDWRRFISASILGFVYVFVLSCCGAEQKHHRNIEIILDDDEIVVLSKTVRCCDNRAMVRIHHSLNNSTAAVCRKNIVLLGVGTAMSTGQYDRLSHAMVRASSNTSTTDENSLVVVVLDPTPYDPVKLSQRAYANAVHQLITMKELERLMTDDDVQFCDDLTLIVGGHSAGGATALNAITNDMFTVPMAGFIGLDPYFVPTTPRNGKLPVPSLLWGFVQTTCRVNVDHAAQAAYDLSTDGLRVMYRLESSSTTQQYSHCCFTDSGCLWVCPCQIDNRNLLHDIGLAVHQFITALQRRSSNSTQRFGRADFPTAQFWLDPSDVTIFMDDNASSSLSLVEEKPSVTPAILSCCDQIATAAVDR
jgi:hypothetical protein